MTDDETEKIKAEKLFERSVSRSKRAANNKWDKEHMKVIGCKLRKEQAEKFAQYAKDNGTTVNKLLKEFIFEKIGNIKTNDNSY